MLTIRACKVFSHALGEYLRQADYYSQGMRVDGECKWAGGFGWGVDGPAEGELVDPIMRILALERELKALSAATATEILRAETARVWELQRQEVIREIWFTRRGTRAVVLLECASEEDARQALGTLPLVREGYIDFEVNALRPYDGFARLFAPGQVDGGRPRD